MSSTPHKDAKAQAKAAKAYEKATRPWYKKKRFWALGLLLLLALSSLLNGGDDKDTAPNAGNPATTAANTAPAKAGTTAANTETAAAKAETAAPAEKPLVVSANKLLSDLEGNALKASQTYKDKYVTVTGKVTNIDASGKYFSIGRTDEGVSFTPITININEDQKAQVANLSTDQKVTVTGRITDVGEVMGYSIDADSIK